MIVILGKLLFCDFKALESFASSAEGAAGSFGICVHLNHLEFFVGHV